MMLPRYGGVLAGVLVAALFLGCERYPITPGEDLDPDASPAVLTAAPDIGRPDIDAGEGTRLQGEYDLVATLADPLGGEDIVTTFIGVVSQEGDLGADATVTIELRDPAMPQAAGPVSAPAAIDDAGGFVATVEELVIPASFNPLFLEDVDATIVFTGQIGNNDCFFGGVELTLRDAQLEIFDNPITIPLSGTFVAEAEEMACE